MKFHDRLFQLRKKEGLTQAELAEKLNVSRQAISKWEMGTATPDTENLLLLSKIFSVSIDYLINNTVEQKLDMNATKATVFKISSKYALHKFIVVACVVLIALIVGAINNNFASIAISFSIIGTLLLIYFAVKMLRNFLSYKK